MFLLIDYGNVLCSPANELQQNSNASSKEEYIPRRLTLLLFCIIDSSHFVSPLWSFVCCLSFVNNSKSTLTNASRNRSSWPDSREILLHQCGVAFAEAQMFLLAKRPLRRGTRRDSCFRRLSIDLSWRIAGPISLCFHSMILLSFIGKELTGKHNFWQWLPLISDSWQNFSWTKFSRIGLSVLLPFVYGTFTESKSL